MLTSLTAGDPFRRGNAARIAGTGAAILVAGTLAPLLPRLAASGVLDAHGLVAPGSPFVAGFVLEPRRWGSPRPGGRGPGRRR